MSSNSRNAPGYVDEDARFYSDPCSFILKSFPPEVNQSFPPSKGSDDRRGLSKYEWPSHLALFEVLLAERCQDRGTVEQVLQEKGYIERWRLWNSFWHEDPRRAGDVIVYRHSSTS
jgi:phosphatidylinositol glycan class B